MKNNIILIGPVGAGKTTVSALLSQELGLNKSSLDDIRWDIYKEKDYDFELANKIMKDEGFLGLYKYWKPFEAYSIKRVLEIYPNHIIDFGAGHSVYESKELFHKVKEVLEPYPNVVLLLPSDDKEESLEILKKRRPDFKFHHLFVNNSSNDKLAKITVYTKGKTPKDTCGEIIRRIEI